MSDVDHLLGLPRVARRLAYASWQRNPALALMFYFCQAPFYPRSVDELDQLKRVFYSVRS